MLNQIRLVSGVILFAYVTVHLINHAFGLWSLHSLEAANGILHLPLHNPVGVSILYGAMLIHMGLSLYALFRRRQLRMKFSEALQLVMGLAIFPLLVGHLLSTRFLFMQFDVSVDYQFVLFNLWHPSPAGAVQQLTVLLVAWIHGCTGLFFWLRLKPWFTAGKHYLFAAALLIPTLSIVGFVQSGKDIRAAAQNPEWLAKAAVKHAAMAPVKPIHAASIGGFLILIAAVLAARAVRLRLEKRSGTVTVRYDNGRTIQFPTGRSILDASRESGVAHASVCGGRGRCSTCRVRIVNGAGHLPAPSAAEQKVLDRVHASEHVRLACQTRPEGGELDVIRILPPGMESVRDGFLRPSHLQGKEIDIAIMFADLRSFTQLSEKKLPYDVVFLLNQYFHSMGAAIEQAGGSIDKFIGDGIMALFGVDSTPATGSRQALSAARQMSNNLADLNKVLASDLDAPLRIGIGIHTGSAIVGEMGYATVKSVTAIGDAVNTASRLEPLTKNYAAELIVSSTVAEYADVDLTAFDHQEVTIRGRDEPLSIRIIDKAGNLPE